MLNILMSAAPISLLTIEVISQKSTERSIHAVDG